MHYVMCRERERERELILRKTRKSARHTFLSEADDVRRGERRRKSIKSICEARDDRNTNVNKIRTKVSGEPFSRFHSTRRNRRNDVRTDDGAARFRGWIEQQSDERIERKRREKIDRRERGDRGGRKAE